MQEKKRNSPPFDHGRAAHGTPIHAKVLILPGWAGGTPSSSGAPSHPAMPHPGQGWMSRWRELYGDEIVAQDDFVAAIKDDWVRRLDVVVSRQADPVVLVAHSLGCLLAASWAASTPNASRVAGALLVAPGDPDREGGVRDKLATWLPIETRALPFPSILVASRNDHSCSFVRAQDFAQSWGSDLFDNGACGHMVGPSDPGDWHEGRRLLAWLANAASSSS